MIRILALLLLLTACTRVVEKPVMSPVDHPAPPKGVAVKCDVEFEPIRLPTTAAEQVAGRQRDRETARQAVDSCDSRRARAVRYGRQLGGNL